MTEGLSQRQLAKREQIASAARRLFLDQGFATTSMDAVTAEAGVSKQTLYSYFPTKVDLLADVLFESVNQINLAPAEAAPMETLADLRAALVDFATRITHALLQPDSIAMLRLVLGEAFRLEGLRQIVRETLPVQILGRSQALLERAAAKHLISLDDPDLAARMFIGPMMTYIALDGFLSVDPPGPPQPAKLEHLVDAFLNTVVVRS